MIVFTDFINKEKKALSLLFFSSRHQEEETDVVVADRVVPVVAVQTVRVEVTGNQTVAVRVQSQLL